MSNDTLIIGIVVAVLVLASIFRSSIRSSSRRSTRRSQPKRFQPYEDQLSGFPYQLQQNFLTPSELNFFHNLRRVVGSKAVICPKVRLGDLVSVKVQDKSQAVGYNNKTNRKHVDYLLCDPSTMRPFVAIELDDSSHQREDRQARDAFVDGVFEAAGLPLIHVPTNRANETEELRAKLMPYLNLSTASAQSPNGTRTTSETPHCPNCTSKMILRTVRSGAKAGSKFWGCPNYPSCRGMMPYTNGAV